MVRTLRKTKIRIDMCMLGTSISDVYGTCVGSCVRFRSGLTTAFQIYLSTSSIIVVVSLGLRSVRDAQLLIRCSGPLSKSSSPQVFGTAGKPGLLRSTETVAIRILNGTSYVTPGYPS